jgi:YtkA-like
MRRRFGILMVGLVLLANGFGPAWAEDLKPIHTQKTKDVVITLKSESGQWKPGKNAFVVEFTSVKDNSPVDAGKVTLNTSMPMPGMAPMIAGARLTPDKTPGRYASTIDFPDAGTRQVTVTWNGAAGKGSTKFSIPVR